MKNAWRRVGVCVGVGCCLILAPFARAQALVRTVDITNLAVTNPKLANGAVNAAKLATNAVTNAKIAKYAVTAAKLAANAVTADKIAFYTRVIVVAPSGGDFTSPVAAMNSIIDASESNPYLVKLMPGVYDIGGGTVQMKPFVSIEGSGEGATQIVGSQNTCDEDPANPGSFLPRYGVVTGSDSSQLRSLLVRNNGAAAGTCAVTAILAVDSDEMTITHVSAHARGSNRNVAIIVRNTMDTDPLWISNVNAYAEGGAMSAAVVLRGPILTPSDEALLVGVLTNTTAFADGAPAGNNFGVVVTNATGIISGGIANAEKALAVDGGSALVQGTLLLGSIGVEDNSLRPLSVVIANSSVLDVSGLGVGTLTVDNGQLSLTNTNLGLSVSMLNSPTVTLLNSSVSGATVASGTLTATNSSFGDTVTVSGGTFKAANSSLVGSATVTGGTATCGACVQTGTFVELSGTCE